MKLQPIVYVTNMEASLRWYAVLLDAKPTATSEYWSTFDVDGTTLALHHVETSQPPGSVSLSLVASAPLESAHQRVAASDEIIDQPFGRSFTVTDPDGTIIQVNEHYED